MALDYRKRGRLIRLRYRLLVDDHVPKELRTYFEESRLPILENVTHKPTFVVEADRELFATDEERGPYGPKEST